MSFTTASINVTRKKRFRILVLLAATELRKSDCTQTMQSVREYKVARSSASTWTAFPRLFHKIGGRSESREVGAGIHKLRDPFGTESGQEKLGAASGGDEEEAAFKRSG